MKDRKDTSLSRAKAGDFQTVSAPAKPDHGENSSSVLTEAPLKPKRGRLDAHDFPDGGGSGGAESFSRKRTKRAPK